MKCPICSAKEIVGLPAAGEYWFCEGCQVAWKKKFPKTSYEKDYYRPASSLASKLFSPVLSFFYSLRTRYARGGSKALWIDVGAGNGKFLLRVKAKRKIGVEVSQAARKMMKERGLEVLTENQFLGRKNLSADVISLWHVLEHLESPKDYLSVTWANLKKGGEIIVGVPNIDSFEFRFFKKDWFHLTPQYHLWHFSPKSLKILLEESGFRIKKIDFWSIEHHPTGLLQSFINKGSVSKNSLHRLVKSIREKNSLKLATGDILVNLFWLSLGFPLVLIVWAIASLTKKGGTFVVVASKIPREGIV